MKNKIIILGITSVLLVSLVMVSFPITSKAAELTTAQTNWFISLLKSFGVSQTKIDDVQKVLSTETPTTIQPTQPATNSGNFCYNWNKNLQIGSKGNDVVALSTALQKEGFTGGMDEKGVYGETMYSAVQDFQLKYNIPHIGVVGPMTRAKLNSLYGCKTTFSTPLTPVTTSVNPTLVANPLSTQPNTSYPVVTYPVDPSQPTTVSVIAGPIINPATGSSYYLLSPTNWRDAEAKAVSMGGHLVTINDANENKWVTDNFANYGGTNRHLWIGLNDFQTENIWKWTNGESVGYLNWASGEPNNGAGIYSKEEAVHIWDPSWGHGTGTWNDAQASLLYNSVVEVGGTARVIPITEPAPVPAPTITSISIGGGDSCIQHTSMCRMEIVGTGFTATGNTVKVGEMSVGINNINQGNLSAYNNKIIVDVPTNINPGTYNVVVSNVNGSSNAKVLTMKSNSTQPYITSVSPSSAPMGSNITITGRNFSKTTTNYIQLSGIPNSTIMLSGLSTDGSSLTVKLPNYNVAAGTVFKIWVDNDEFGASDENKEYMYNPVTFTVTAPAPVMMMPAETNR